MSECGYMGLRPLHYKPYLKLELTYVVHFQHNKKGQLTGEHCFEIVTGRGHEDSVDWESFLAVPRNQDDITESLICPKSIKALWEKQYFS